MLVVTEKAACALILLTGSGCALFENANSLSRLFQSDAVSVQQAEPAKQLTDMAEHSTPDDHRDLNEHEFVTTFEEPTAPAGRLLNPDFGDSAASRTEDSSGGHSFPANAPSIPASVHPTMIQPVTQTHTILDGPKGQQPADADPLFVPSMERVVDAKPVTQLETDSGQAVQPAEEGIIDETISHEAEPAASGPPQPEEQSVLDRFWKFAPERSPRNLLGRQFEKISDPRQWDLFGNRDDPEQSSRQQPPVTAEMQALPTTAETIEDAADAGDLLDTLIVREEHELNTWPRTEEGSPLESDEFRRRQLNLRLLRLISDEPAAAAEAIDSMSPDEQKFWQELILGISQFRNPDEDVDYGEHMAATIGQFRTAVRQLEPLSTLSIRRLDFCSKIHGFGSIETFPTNTFEPGERLLIYAEVDNLQSEVSPLGTYRTSFGGTLQIWSASSDEPIESWELQTISDDSTTRRLDYYQSCEFTLPAYLPEGVYEIRLKMQDDISSRTVDSVLEFAVQ